ncbi:pleckstrin homology domain-containing family A member 5-like isoform X3 [Alosa alosa]|uniref:pleckstrin homology domain-containing family A member 5-like isoform X3 n=1 Tax=Alosa alosa TaxID=278164 RepID=UPI0020154775|nr:pleckstrin homology domain-containing family A member 5-like isoform X3 [Alosa alosa]
MAADLNPDWISCLPSSWSSGVTRDGRIFFINEEAKSTTWLHPVSGEAVITGHRKTPDLPTGWEEGYTFEGARCFINHNERKVTCKHPVTGSPSQDNCIFVVNEQLHRPASKPPANEKKERPLSTMSETSNYTGGSGDYATYPNSPAGTQRPSRPSKKIHNFGKRSNSIKRNPNAPVIKSNWLYKQDSTGMKLWKKRWFVLSDMCLFYYRDEKEEGILGSILLPSFHISLLSVDDHINRKYAFKATHPNMRTYYFCSDTAKDMESWMKVMTDAALVHSNPVNRLERLKVEQCGPQDVMNNGPNHHPAPQQQPQPQVPDQPDQSDQQPLEQPQSAEQGGGSGGGSLERQHDAERYGFQTDGGGGGDWDRPPLTKITGARLQQHQQQQHQHPANGGPHQGLQSSPAQLNGTGAGERSSPGAELGNGPSQRAGAQTPVPEPQRVLQRTNSMQQLEQWVRSQRGRGQDDDTRSVSSYQTLPRNMPSHRPPVAMPMYADGYRTLPRNSLARPDSVCSISPSLYDRMLGPAAASTPGAGMDKRRSMRDDTLWQLYEWQQRQAYVRHPLHPPQRPAHQLYGGMPSPKTMINLSEHTGPSIPPSPSHGSLYQAGYSPLHAYNAGSSRSELSSPVYGRGDLSIDRRHRGQLNKYGYPPDRRSMPTGIPIQTITPQSLQGKTPEELTLLLIKLRRQQAEITNIREHTLVQLMQLNLDAQNPKNDILSHHLQRTLMYLDEQMKENDPLILTIHTMIENSAPRPQLYQQMSPDDYRDHAYMCRPEEHDIDTKLSRLCEQDKVVRSQEEKLQQLHREKHTLETALLSASQEIEMSADDPVAVQSVVQQRDLLQSGLLSTCRELSRVNTELERSWREYDRLEADVAMAKSNLLEQLEALGSPQTEPPSQQHVHIQKELWRIQDVMEALNKNKPPRNADGSGFFTSTPISSHQKSEGPDYRLYKSEPELTTVAEVDETNGEDRSEHAMERDSSAKGMSYPVGIVPPRTKSPMPESSSIASYVTLRKNKKPDPRAERPRSAVEQLSAAESSARPRMSVEEQMERIRRHQQGALQQKKKSLAVLGGSPGAQENSPSRSPSFSKENPFRTMQSTQGRRRNEGFCTDLQELEASLREQEVVQEHESPAEEIARLKEAVDPEHFNMDRELSKPEKVVIPERYMEPEPEEALSPEEEADKRKKVDRIKALIAKNSMQNMHPGVALSPEVESEEEATAQTQEKIINISYELAAEASKRSKLVAAKSLPSSPQSPVPPATHTPLQLTDGTHFMCV